MNPVKEAKKTAAVKLGDLLDAGHGAVVTLVAGDTCLAAHRAVLAARSPVFEAMFHHDTLEASSGQVAIPDVEGPVLRQLLDYCYTLQVPQLPDMAPQLLAAADKYGVSVLKAACEQQVAAQLDTENAAAAAVLAVRHSCSSLRQAAIAYIQAHTHQVMATQGWAEAVLSQPKDVVEVSRLLTESPAETSAPASAGSGTTPTTQPHSDLSQTAASAAPPTADRPTPPPAGAAVSRLRAVSAEEKGRRLRQAAEEGDVAELQALLAAGADVAARDDSRWTALHCAADKGHVDAASCLVEAGAAVDARSKTQQTPLHRAARYGHVAVVELLLAASADVYARDGREWTPLHFAAQDGHVAVAELLLAASADHNARDDWGWTALHLAAQNGQSGVAAAILRAGADRGARTNQGETALDIARRKNKQRLVEILT